MPKAERGTKRLCGECGAKYYDLNREPITCPLCEAVFVVEVPAAKTKAAPAAPKPVEPEKPASEPEKVKAEGPEIVSLDEVKADEDSANDPDVEDIVIDLDDDDDDAEDDNTFLATDDEEGADVSDIIPAVVKPEPEG